MSEEKTVTLNMDLVKSLTILGLAVGLFTQTYISNGRLDEIEKDLGLVKQVTGYTVCVKSHGCEFYPTLKVHGMITDDGRNTGIYETEKGD